MSAQIRRALISISSNIWEGFGRKTNKDFIKFLSYTLWSLNEVKTQFYLSYMLGYITKEELDKILSETTELIKKTKWFMSYLNKTSF
jgi:four helix bundle protein